MEVDYTCHFSRKFILHTPRCLCHFVNISVCFKFSPFLQGKLYLILFSFLYSKTVSQLLVQQVSFVANWKCCKRYSFSFYIFLPYSLFWVFLFSLSLQFLFVSPSLPIISLALYFSLCRSFVCLLKRATKRIWRETRGISETLNQVFLGGYNPSSLHEHRPTWVRPINQPYMDYSEIRWSPIPRAVHARRDFRQTH